MTIAVLSTLLNQAPGNGVHPKSVRAPLSSVLASLLAALVFLTCCGVPAWAQKTVSVSSTTSTKGTIDVDQYIAEGYSVTGPTMLESVSSEVLVFPGLTGQKGLEISLRNKTVVTLDATGKASRFAALGKGVSVLVCHRKDRVVIYLVSATKGTSSYAY
jgi:hypothetical protein